MQESKITATSAKIESVEHDPSSMEAQNMEHHGHGQAGIEFFFMAPGRIGERHVPKRVVNFFVVGFRVTNFDPMKTKAASDEQ